MNNCGRLTWYSLPGSTPAMVTLVTMPDHMQYVLWRVTEGEQWTSSNYDFIGHHPGMPHIPDRVGCRVGLGYLEVMQQYLVKETVESNIDQTYWVLYQARTQGTLSALEVIFEFYTNSVPDVRVLLE